MSIVIGVMLIVADVEMLSFVVFRGGLADMKCGVV